MPDFSRCFSGQVTLASTIKYLNTAKQVGHYIT